MPNLNGHFEIKPFSECTIDDMRDPLGDSIVNLGIRRTKSGRYRYYTGGRSFISGRSKEECHERACRFMKVQRYLFKWKYVRIIRFGYNAYVKACKEHGVDTDQILTYEDWCKGSGVDENCPVYVLDKEDDNE